MKPDTGLGMKLDTDLVGNALVVSIAGRVDWSGAQGFGLFLEDLVRRHGAKPIILDVADMTYISSGGIRAVLIAARKQAQKSARFAICCSEDSFFRSLLETTGLDKALELHQTREATLLAFGVED